MKKELSLALVFLLILSVFFCSCDAGNGFFSDIISDLTSDDEGTLPDERELTFVSINDLHGYIEQDAAGRGGIANTAYTVDGLSRYFGDSDPQTDTRDDIILFANGDMFQGTAVSNMTRGASVIAAMNEMGFDGMGIGNHEFDWGIETILPFFDGDERNGEANFPLVNSNVYKMSATNYLSEVSQTDSVVSSLTVEKEGVKIGLISVIGPCRNSILQSHVADYTFTDVTPAVEREAKLLHESGVELISVNIHYGNSSGVLRYDENLEIAHLKADDGEYLVDIVFNGHTHSKQTGTVARDGGTDMPVIQAGANNEAVGYAKLTYNVKTGKTSLGQFGYKTVESAGTNADPDVKKVVEEYCDECLSTQPILAESGVTLSYKGELYAYTAELMVNAFGSDYAVSNTGGLRETGGIVKGRAIYESNLYEIIPFDNDIYYITVPGSAIYDLYKKYPPNDYLYYGKSRNAPEFNALAGSKQLYSVAVIDYVYTGKYYASFRSQVKSEVNTHIYLRDLLAEDIKLNRKSYETWDPAKGAKIGKQDW